MDRHNFITPHGLKVRLNAKILFSLIMGYADNHSTSDMMNNTHVSGALNWIDSLFEFKSCYTWYFALAYIVFSKTPDSMIFFVEMTTIFIICIYSYISPFNITIVDSILHWLYFPYYMCRNNFIRSAILVIVAIICHRPIIILWYAIFFVGYNLFEFFIVNNIIGSITKKKYGYGFMDTELCAFRVAYIYLNTDSPWVKSLKLNSCADVIRWYMKHVSTEE